MKRNKPYTTNEYITIVQKIHNNYYTYEKTNYLKSKAKITVTCPIHGDFEQIAADHKNGSGCPKCKAINQAKRQYSSSKTFIEKADLVHSGKYTYSECKYVNSKQKVTITCSIHGNFDQTPKDHLQGKGCPICGRTKTLNLYKDSDWETAGEKSPLFQGFQLYIVECWNHNEHFIKVGKTYTNIYKRLRKNTLPYEFKILNQYYGSAKFISELERNIHTTIKEFSYIPKISFGGRYECFSSHIKELIITTSKDLYHAQPTGDNKSNV